MVYIWEDFNANIRDEQAVRMPGHYLMPCQQCNSRENESDVGIRVSEDGHA